MLEDSCRLSLVLDRFQLLFQLLVLSLETADFLFTHSFLLVDGLVVALILDAGVFFEGAPLVLKFSHFLPQRVAVHAVPLCVFVCVRKLAAEISPFIACLVK